MLPAFAVRDCKRTPTGIDYIGNRSETDEGVQCQTWGVAFKEHLYIAEGTPDDTCRNPAGLAEQPFCMIHRYPFAGYCDISYCGKQMWCPIQHKRCSHSCDSKYMRGDLPIVCCFTLIISAMLFRLDHLIIWKTKNVVINYTARVNITEINLQSQYVDHIYEL